MEKKPPLLAHEEIVLEAPGFCKETPRSGWKPGHLYLTDTRLFLWQPAGIILQIPLERVQGVSIQQRGFVLRSKNALCISFRKQTNEGTAQIWVITKDVETWKNRILERSLLEIDQEAIAKIAEELDAESREILLCVWQNRHAAIDELARVYNAPNHMDVLHRIKDIINPTSQRVIGFPVLTFERSKVDGFTGKQVMFNWWIVGDSKVSVPNGSAFRAKEDKEQSLLDVFDEEGYLNVIMELKGVREEDISLTVVEDRLTVSCETPGSSYCKEVTLPAKVDSEETIRRYHNNILEIRLQKLKSNELAPEVKR